MKKRGWRTATIIIVIVLLCLLPIIPVSADVIEEQLVEEDYITLEPYTTQEEVQEPYKGVTDYTTWVEGYTDKFGHYIPGHYVTEQRYETKIRTVTNDVTQYKEVLKTRMVSRPVVVTQTELVSVLNYLLR